MNEPHPIGEPHWFDIPALRQSLVNLLMMEPGDFAQWQSGEHAAEMVSRIDRILGWVEEKQASKESRPVLTPLTRAYNSTSLVADSVFGEMETSPIEGVYIGAHEGWGCVEVHTNRPLTEEESRVFYPEIEGVKVRILLKIPERGPFYDDGWSPDGE